jgi:hypothetical protein
MTRNQRRLMGISIAALLTPATPQAQGHGPHAVPVERDSRLAALDTQALAAVHEALADERRTEGAYEAVIGKLGQVRPFSNAVRAETRHAKFLEVLLTARGLAVPARPMPAGPAAPASLADACVAAAAAEKDNAALYDRLLAVGTLPDDVRRAFEHNRWASRERHLPAFERCGGRATPDAGESAPGCDGQAGVPPCGPGPGRGHGRSGGGRACGCGCGAGAWGCGPAAAAKAGAGQ